MHVPHWIIRAIRFVLRHSGYGKAELLSMIDESAEAQTVELRIAQFEMLSLAVEGVDPESCTQNA